MNTAYLDSSIILRALLRELRGTETNLESFERLVTSELTAIECCRVIDRIRVTEMLTDEEISLRHFELQSALKAMDIILICKPILTRAREAFPTVVRTLDAIHLSSALLARKADKTHWTFLTQDRQQRIAAQAVGFNTAL